MASYNFIKDIILFAYQLKVFIDTKYYYINKIKTNYLNLVDEVVLFFKDFELFIFLFFIFSSASAAGRPRRNYFIFYIFEKYEID